MSAPRPPRLAEWLVAFTAAAEDREVLVGDLAEEFRQRARDHGMADARRWYWTQCRHSIGPNLRGRREAGPARSRAIGSPRTGLFGGLGRDCRDAFRSLRASPGITAVALVVLTLGIGTSTAIFSVVDAVVLRDLPFPHTQDLTVIGVVRNDDRARLGGVPPQDFLDWKAQDSVFEHVAAFATGTATLQGSQPESLRVVRTTADLFSVLRATPRLGALFTAANETAGADRVVVMSDAFWRRRFGADPRVIGQSISLDNNTYDVVGVMPPAFQYPIDRATDLWMPYVMAPADRIRGTGRSASLQVLARLRAGVTLDAARGRIAAVAAGLAKEFPNWFRNRTTKLEALRDTLILPGVRSWMLMLLAAVGFVLLIACVNVASLLLARATARSRDMGVRAALGASRWQLIRAVLVESLLLSAAGTALGVLATYLGIGAITAALPVALPRSTTIAVNWRVLLVATSAAGLTGILCGLLPALQGTRADLTRALRESGRANSATRSRQRLRGVLVAAEVGLALVLLVGAGLFMSSFVRLTSVDLGLDYRHVLTVGITPRGAQSRDARAAAAARIAPLVSSVLPAIRALPGVEYAAALSGTRPFEGGSDRTNVVVPGRENDFTGDDDAVDVYRVTADYTQAIGVTLVRGRSFLSDESAPEAAAVLLNETAAARFFPGIDPIGQPIRVLGDRVVVGIVHDVRAGGPETALRPEAYLSFAPGWSPFAYVVVRTHGDPSAIVPGVKAALWSSAPDLPLADIETLEGFFARLVAQRRFNMLLIGLFGTLALAIAAVGVFGVMAHVVEQRRAEIGLRMALGAERGAVVRMVLRRALGIVAIGLVAGLAVTWPLSGALGAFLFQVSPHDAVVYALAAAVLFGAALVAALGPARRAASIDPIVALRAD